MKSSPLAITALTLVGSCGFASPAEPAARWYEVSDGDWRVPAHVVDDMRSRLQAAADGAVAESVTKQQRSVVQDTVQYQGFLDRLRHHKLVELFGMCKTDASPAKLRDFWAFVHDGGNCYYWARYDATLRRFVSFQFNSAA